MTISRFESCLAEILRHEGGYADHPADPGGATNHGITRKTLARWRKVSPWWDLPKQAVETLGVPEAARIYRATFWDTIRGEQLPAGLDLALFDFAVNSGPARAVKTLQAALGVKADGIVGPLTLGALHQRVRQGTVPDLVEALCDRRLGFLRLLKTFPVFGRGWTTRVAAVRSAALAAAGAPIPSSTSTTGSIPLDLVIGYRTYIIAGFMLLAGLVQILGIDLPSLDGASAGNLIMEALAVIFLRKGLKGDIKRA